MSDPLNLYFDYNATTPLAPEVFRAMEPFWSASFANPSSLHRPGQEAARAMKQARRDIARFFGAADEREIIFTSGGTESNNTAIRSAFRTTGKRRMVTTAVEHSSIHKFAQVLENEGYEICRIPVDSEGRLNMEKLAAELTEDTAVVSVMMANNETGILFPVSEIGAMVKSKGILFHVDAVQAAGKCPIFLKSMNADFVSFSPHKFYGPKGIGLLYAARQIPFSSFISGGSQERGRRAGTENLPGAVGAAAACALLEKNFQDELARLASLRDEFENVICRELTGVSVTGAGMPRIPNTSHLRFSGIEAESLLIALDQKGVFASSGSACLSGSQEPSHVLKAMGYSDDEAASAVRFSFGRYTTPRDVEMLCSVLKETAEAVRNSRKHMVER